jgi:thiamine-phosphate pyrophosphorylase
VSRFHDAISGCYPIVDFDACAAHGFDPALLGRIVIEQRPRLVQVRAKGKQAGALLAVLDALVGPAREADVLLVVNDRPDLAALAGAPVVHVGQEDLAVADVRRFDPTLGVGVSTHTLEQVQAALAARPDYVAFGPVFATGSKQRPERIVGAELLSEAHALTRAAQVPLVAIGGISTARLAAVRPHCEAAAVIAALFEGGSSRTAVQAQVKTLVEQCA